MHILGKNLQIVNRYTETVYFMQKLFCFLHPVFCFFPIYSLLMLAFSSDKSGILGAFNNILRMICRIYQKMS